MSLIVLYFLYSTSVLSFYIDVVLTLSIGFMLNTNFWWLFIISTHNINRNDNNVVEDRAVLTLKGTASFNMSNVNTHSFWPFRTRFLSVTEQGANPKIVQDNIILCWKIRQEQCLHQFKYCCFDTVHLGLFLWKKKMNGTIHLSKMELNEQIEE